MDELSMHEHKSIFEQNTMPFGSTPARSVRGSRSRAPADGLQKPSRFSIASTSPPHTPYTPQSNVSSLQSELVSERSNQGSHPSLNITHLTELVRPLLRHN